MRHNLEWKRNTNIIFHLMDIIIWFPRSTSFRIMFRVFYTTWFYSQNRCRTNSYLMHTHVINISLLSICNKLCQGLWRRQTNITKNYSETDHQPRLDAWDKCSGLVHWEDPEESGGEGGGIRRGNTCNSMADSYQCMTKPTTIL